MTSLASLSLTGACNLCGLCCTAEIDGRLFRCQHLAPTFRALGQPLATTCRKYGARYDGMPITMVHEDGQTQRLYPAVCAKGSPAEALTILTRGIGRGCSLEVVQVEPPVLAADAREREARG